jgi:hypothetical protein
MRKHLPPGVGSRTDRTEAVRDSVMNKALLSSPPNDAMGPSWRGDARFVRQ